MGGNKKQKKDSSSWLSRFLVSLLLGANLVTLVLLWGCCATTWVDPVHHPRMAVLGLAFPAFLLANLVFIPLWVVCKPRMVVVPLVGMALCGGYILDYFPLHFGSTTADSARPEGTLRVISWNVHNPAVDNHDGLPEFAEYLLTCDADVICLQEFGSTDSRYRELLDGMTAKGYHQKGDGHARYVFSRYPILDVTPVTETSKEVVTNGYSIFTLQADNDTLTLVNCHLQSIGMSPEDKGKYAEALHSLDRSEMKAEMKFLSEKLASPVVARARQIQEITAHLDSLPPTRSVWVCGDFNDTPISYAYQQISRRLCNAYRTSGRGIGVSYNEEYFPIRIDHIFFSHDWECSNACIDSHIHVSDHFPAIAHLKKKQK